MANRTRSKASRYRGSTTHGCGSMKKRRGAGNRGGRGNAGSGKKGDGKKPSFWKINKGGKDPSKRGFSSIFKEDTTINVGHLNSIAVSLKASGKALEQSGSLVINLRELGYTKLLGAGKVTQKLKIGVEHASPAAIEKIKAAGGNVDVTDSSQDTESSSAGE